MLAVFPVQRNPRERVLGSDRLGHALILELNMHSALGHRVLDLTRT